ncbi:MAG: Glutathione peroxidase [Bacteroidota bacterium]|jgi:glutathione peroxidase|nr:Glutathione peroxidase [Bacteroidota bacterium]
MKALYIVAALVLLFLLFYRFKKPAVKTTIYQFKAKTLEGSEFDFSTLRGKKILIVNTASKCGFTPQYKELEELYQKYKDKDFVVIGFPCNQFGEQEPGSNEEIKDFCSRNYGVTFPMMEKTNVKGDSISPIYKWLTSKSENGVENSSVKWNFQKYMIDENGFLVGNVSSLKGPMTSKIITWIEKK